MDYINSVWIDDYLIQYYYSSNGFMHVSSSHLNDSMYTDSNWRAYMFYSESEAIAIHLYRYNNIDMAIDHIEYILTNNKTEANQ